MWCRSVETWNGRLVVPNRNPTPASKPSPTNFCPMRQRPKRLWSQSMLSSEKAMKSWLKLSTMASTRWQQPLRRHRCLGKRQQDLDSHLHHHHLLHHQQHRRWHHQRQRCMECQAMPPVMRLHRSHHRHRRYLCPQLQLWEQRCWMSNHRDLWSWWLQMNQELHARPCHQHGTSPEANFQGRIWMSSVLVAFTMLEDSTADSLTGSFQSEFGKIEPEVAKFPEGNNSFEGADLWLCLTEAAAWVCVARRIGFIASRFTQLQPRVQSRAAESQKERIASHLNLIASHLNWIANHLNAWCTRFHCRSRPRNNRSCQFRAACISCVGNRCQGIQFCLQKPSNYLAEAVHRFCRCLTVATVLDFSCLVMSIHVMFISLFWIWCLLFHF